MAVLLEYGADIQAHTPLGWSALVFAALHEQARAVHWLVARGARVVAEAVVLATCSGSARGLRALIDHFSGDVAAMRTAGTGKTLLHLACQGMCHLRRDRPTGYLACIGQLLRCGVPVDALEPRRGRTCLQSFVGEGRWSEQDFEASEAHMAVLEILCHRGASPTAEDC